MILFSDVVEFYQYFYSKKFDSPKYKFKPSDKGLKAINGFLDSMKKNYPTSGRGFLWRYFTFQFLYWEELEIEAFYGQFRVDLVVGKKAFQRWRDRNQEFDFRIDDNDLREKYGISERDLVRSKNEAPVRYPFEEATKMLHHNTNEGYAICLSITTLYDDQQQACTTCNFRQDCKNILKKTFPVLYAKRGYDKD